MRLFYLITKSEAGGAQTHIFQLTKYFIQLGNELAVMAYPGGWLENEIKKLGAKFYPNFYFSNRINPIDDLKAIRTIKKAIFDFKPDLVSCHSSKAGFLGRLAIKNKIPTIFTAHGWAFTEGSPFFRKCLAIFAEKLASKYCEKIICVSNFDRELAIKYKIAGQAQLLVIHNGVEKSFEIGSRKIGPRKIVFVGRLTKPKEPILLLKAFNELPIELKEKAEVLIIGEGPKRKELERFNKENNLETKIKLLGALPREEVFKILKQSEIFVLVSKWEGFPRSILEAMSCGLAIISTDVGGVKEAIDENCGILIKRGDKEGLKNALEKLLKTPSLIKKMGQSAREKAEKEFPLEKMLRETEKTYTSLLKSN